MKNILNNIAFANFDQQPPATKQDLETVGKALQIRFPSDYVEFMLHTNGGEGAVGEDNYLSLWNIQDIITKNEEYSVNEFAPGLILIGSDGGGTAYGFDFRNEHPKLIEVDLIGLEMDPPFYSADSFLPFLEHLSNS